MRYLIRMSTVALIVASLILLGCPTITWADKGGGGKGSPGGFGKGKKSGWHGEDSPPGYDKGKKKGWDGEDEPPGLDD